jgi:hypothetical protein
MIGKSGDGNITLFHMHAPLTLTDERGHMVFTPNVDGLTFKSDIVHTAVMKVNNMSTKEAGQRHKRNILRR